MIAILRERWGVRHSSIGEAVDVLRVYLPRFHALGINLDRNIMVLVVEKQGRTAADARIVQRNEAGREYFHVVRVLGKHWVGAKRAYVHSVHDMSLQLGCHRNARYEQTLDATKVDATESENTQ
ncbi:MAG: hypothetical protein H7251_12275 [Acetobacteraceae bacterium]|nr:hypothetical protein [Acetobacteraceae bacterium]